MDMYYKMFGDFYTLMKPYLKKDRDLKGKVCILVNVDCASQKAEKAFRSLSILYSQYKKKGVEVFAFPCFQFGGNGSREEIVQYCKDNGFEIGEIMDEIQVNGPDTPTVYKLLKAAKPGMHGEFIPENFTYFIIDKRGKVYDRFDRVTDVGQIDYVLYQML